MAGPATGIANSNSYYGANESNKSEDHTTSSSSLMFCRKDSIKPNIQAPLIATTRAIKESMEKTQKSCYFSLSIVTNFENERMKDEDEKGQHGIFKWTTRDLSRRTHFILLSSKNKSQNFFEALFSSSSCKPRAHGRKQKELEYSHYAIFEIKKRGRAFYKLNLDAPLITRRVEGKKTHIKAPECIHFILTAGNFDVETNQFTNELPAQRFSIKYKSAPTIYINSFGDNTSITYRRLSKNYLNFETGEDTEPENHPLPLTYRFNSSRQKSETKIVESSKIKVAKREEPKKNSKGKRRIFKYKKEDFPPIDGWKPPKEPEHRTIF